MAATSKVMENVLAKDEDSQANGYERDDAAVATHRRVGGTKRASTRECLVPPPQALSPPVSEYTVTVGGEYGTGVPLRMPSPLYFLRGESRNVPHPLSSNESCSSSVVRWGKKEIAEWLDDIGLGDYLPVFEEHAVVSGKILVQLTEEHLKEMGVRKVGHRLALVAGLNDLRMKEIRVGVVSGEE